jgi:hypothetical protein
MWSVEPLFTLLISLPSASDLCAVCLRGENCSGTASRYRYVVKNTDFTARFQCLSRILIQLMSFLFVLSVAVFKAHLMTRGDFRNAASRLRDYAIFVIFGAAILRYSLASCEDTNRENQGFASSEIHRRVLQWTSVEISSSDRR